MSELALCVLGASYYFPSSRFCDTSHHSIQQLDKTQSFLHGNTEKTWWCFTLPMKPPPGPCCPSSQLSRGSLSNDQQHLPPADACGGRIPPASLSASDKTSKRLKKLPVYSAFLLPGCSPSLSSPSPAFASATITAGRFLYALHSGGDCKQQQQNNNC